MLMQLMAQMFGPKPVTPTPAGPDIGSMLSQLRNDPQGDANHGYVPGVGGGPWAGPIHFNSGAEHMSPEALAATQGRSATTQWAQQGQVPSVDPGSLNSLMSNMTPIPTGNQGEPTVNQFSDPFFNRRLQAGGDLQAPDISTMMQRLMPNPHNPSGPTRKAVPVGLGGVYGQNNTPQLPQGAVMGDGTTNYFPQLGDPRYVDQMSVPYGEQTPPTMNSLLKKKKPVATR